MGKDGKSSAVSAGSKYFIVVVVLCVLANFVCNYPMYQLSPIASKIMEAFSLDNSQYSSVFSAAMIPGLVLSIVAGLLVDKIGPKRAVSYGLAIAAIGMVARIWVGSYAGMMLCMICLGIGATAMNCAGPKLIVSWSSPEKLGTLLGIVMGGASLSMFVGMGTTAYFPSISSAFTFAAVLSAIAAVLWVVFMREAKTEDKAQEEESASIGECLKVVAKNPAAWVLGLMLFGIMTCNVALSAYLPSALANVRGFSATDAGLVSSIMVIGGVFGAIIGPTINARIGNSKLFLIVSCVASGLLAAFAWQAPEGFPMLALLILLGFAIGGASPVIMSLPSRIEGIGPRYAGTAQGFCSTFMTLGPVVVPAYIIAPIAGSNYTTMILMAASCMVVALVAAFFLPKIPGEKR